MLRFTNGLLISVIFSSILAPCSYADVGLIPEGRAVSANYRAKDTFADYFSFSVLSDELENVSTSVWRNTFDIRNVALSKSDRISTVNAFNSGSVLAPGDGALQETDNLFQINKKGLGGARSDNGTFSSASTSQPETWTMILVGVMLVAYQLRRKQRGLMASTLVSVGRKYSDV